MIGICIMITLVIAGGDLMLKAWVEEKIPFRKDQKILHGFGILRKVHNKGMMLNLAEKHSKVVRTISVIATAIVLIMQFVLGRIPGYKEEQIGLAFILGGAISNTYDRVRRGYVVDYLAFNNKNKKISKVTYNIGDFGIFAGILLILLSSFAKD